MKKEKSRISLLVPQPPLSWRMEPNESQSDWRIEVQRESGSIDVYHVHKTAIAVGSQRCEYFVASIRHDGKLSKALSGVSRLQLYDLAADAVPDLLDFVYSKEGLCDLTTANATALLYLADYLDVHLLRKKVGVFLER